MRKQSSPLTSVIVVVVREHLEQLCDSVLSPLSELSLQLQPLAQGLVDQSVNIERRLSRSPSDERILFKYFDSIFSCLRRGCL
jgi:hypothetical protein